MKIIVTGHGHFASGIESTVKLLAGGIPGVEYIDFTEEMTETDLAAKFPKEDNLLFFCDLAGGTPYKQAALLSVQFSNIEVLAGCNVASLLEVGLTADLSSLTDLQNFAQQLMEASHAGITQFKVQKFVEETEEEGI